MAPVVGGQIWRGRSCVRNFKQLSGHFSCGYPHHMRYVEYDARRRRSAPATAASAPNPKSGAQPSSAPELEVDSDTDSGEYDDEALRLSAAERAERRTRKRKFVFYSADDGVYALVVA
jgi:hypothetical protein